MRVDRTRRASKRRALPAILILFLSSICVPASLIVRLAAGCEMVCCPAHRDGQGDHCCAFKHKRGKNHSGKLQAVVASSCPTPCASPPSSAQFFPRGLNREITQFHSLAYTTPLEHERGRLIYHSFRTTPCAPRAPPSLFG
jgi:hypothetical protein